MIDNNVKEHTFRNIVESFMKEHDVPYFLLERLRHILLKNPSDDEIYEAVEQIHSMYSYMFVKLVGI